MFFFRKKESTIIKIQPLFKNWEEAIRKTFTINIVKKNNNNNLK